MKVLLIFLIQHHSCERYLIGLRLPLAVITRLISQRNHLTIALDNNVIAGKFLAGGLCIDRYRRGLRLGKFDVLVGINLLREGLDIPEVSLVAILDADKEGFLRSARSLIQTCGRAARNLSGRVIMYADNTTLSMQSCIDETNRRRTLQREYNKTHHITPQSVKKGLRTILESVEERDYYTIPIAAEAQEDYVPLENIPKLVKKLRKEMLAAAKELNFEKAAELRDRIKRLEDKELALR